MGRIGSTHRPNRAHSLKNDGARQGMRTQGSPRGLTRPLPAPPEHSSSARLFSPRGRRRSRPPVSGTFLPSSRGWGARSRPRLARSLTAMAEDFEFADQVPPSFDRTGKAVADAGGFNPGLVVLLLVVGILLIFLVGNYLLYVYAQKTLPPKKKKPVSKKKMKREKLKQGVSAPGE
ncbi:hypothetical protein NL676_018266 [Syzygium grande]|nr:hypothetical protein NL676_018266 [Syzygium grande]